jgi:hypothetical protein
MGRVQSLFYLAAEMFEFLTASDETSCFDMRQTSKLGNALAVS